MPGPGDQHRTTLPSAIRRFSKAAYGYLVLVVFSPHQRPFLFVSLFGVLGASFEARDYWKHEGLHREFFIVRTNWHRIHEHSRGTRLCRFHYHYQLSNTLRHKNTLPTAGFSHHIICLICIKGSWDWNRDCLFRMEQCSPPGSGFLFLDDARQKGLEMHSSEAPCGIDKAGGRYYTPRGDLGMMGNLSRLFFPLVFWKLNQGLFRVLLISILLVDLGTWLRLFLFPLDSSLL